MASLTNGDEADSARVEAPLAENLSTGRPPIVRSAIAGMLMGLANLVPGVSGGTMVVVMGLYDDFIEAIAGLTRLTLTKRNLLFLGIVGAAAATAIGTLAGTLERAVTNHESAMFSLFIGMTLGGAPLLVRMIERFDARTIGGMIAGVAIMLLIALTRGEPDPGVTHEAAVAPLSLQEAYGLDVLAGVLGMSAMVLPGISGAYMLLILGRYRAILGAISIFKDALLQGGSHPELGTALRVLVPTAIGAVLSLVVFSNVLRWMLRRCRSITLGFLLGILFGSVVGIWPFDDASLTKDYLIGGGLAVGGFLATVLLSRLGV